LTVPLLDPSVRPTPMNVDLQAELAALFGTRIDRRRFLKSSGLGVALLGIGTLLPEGCARYPKPSAKLRFFTAKEYAVVNAVAGRILGAAEEVGAGSGQVDVAANLDPWAATWDEEAQQQLRLMLRVFEHGTSLFDLQRKRFTRLPEAAQNRYLDGWMRSTLGARRVVFRALKTMSAAGFFQTPQTWPALGYDGPWLGRIKASALQQPEAAVPLATVGHT
jgi:Gluconate 2-dehydrogenase subunit 3